MTSSIVARCVRRAASSAPLSSRLLQSSFSQAGLSPITSQSSLSPSVRGSRLLHSVARKPRISPYNIDPNFPLPQASPQAALQRKEHSLPERTGTLALKRGMTAIYDTATGKRTPCTVLQFDCAQVVYNKTIEKEGYYAVQIGAGVRKPKNVTLPMQGHFEAAGVYPKRMLSEFMVKNKDALPPLGSTIHADWYSAGQFVDIQAKTKGKGFQGGMKRHGWSGQPASHGQSKTHRVMGSSGGSQGSGSRVIPGKKMAGRMGHENQTLLKVEVLKVDADNDLLLVKGPVPGPNGAYVKIRDSLRAPWPEVEAVPESILPSIKEAPPRDAQA